MVRTGVQVIGPGTCDVQMSQARRVTGRPGL